MCLGLVLCALSAGYGQESAPAGSPPQLVDEPKVSKPAEALYLKLRSVGLDEGRVFRVREAALDRPSIHISLDDGTIAFTQDVGGKITGAFFEGDGEVLLTPPNQVERQSMALFTGAAILEEKFVTAYFRFNDDTFEQLRPFLRPAENPHQSFMRWNETAQNLASDDALRLLMTLVSSLPPEGQAPPPVEVRPLQNEGRLLHVRVQGRKLGNFDLNFDSNAPEQVWAGQAKTFEGETFYDVWTSFPLASPGSGSQSVNEMSAESGKTGGSGIASYVIKSEVRPPTGLSADARVLLTIPKGETRALLFEMSRSLRIEKVEADGKPVEFIHNPSMEGTQLARRGNDWVAVVFPGPLRAGQQVELCFTYSGEVLSDAGGGLLYVGARGNWFPTRSFAISNFDLTFRYPAGWTLVATGKRVEDVGKDPAGGAAGQQVSRWVSDRPLPLAGFNLGKYTRVTAQAGSIPVETYASSQMEHGFPKPTVAVQMPRIIEPPDIGARRDLVVLAPMPPSPARNAQNVADAAARAIEFYSHRFGPYPYSSLAVTQKPGEVSQGWPGLIFLSSFSFLTDNEKSELHMDPVARALSNDVIAHETAHQWWGDLVLWAGYRDQWIVEALSDYSSLMLLETQGPQKFRLILDKYREDLLRKNKQGDRLMDAGPVTLGLRLSSSHFPRGYDAISYGRGVWLLHMLRNMLRDTEAKTKRPAVGTQPPPVEEPFVRALRKLRERYEGKSMSTGDFLRVFEEELPKPLWHEGRRSLEWFLNSWVNGTAIPHFQLQKLQYTDRGGSTMVTGNIVEKEAPRDLVTPVPVYGLYSGGRTVLLGQVFVDEEQTPFRIVAPAGTRKVVLDPYQTLLTR